MTGTKNNDYDKKFDEINQVLRKFQNEFDLEMYHFKEHPDNNLWDKIEDHTKDNPDIRITYCDGAYHESCLLVHVPVYHHDELSNRTHYAGDKVFYITQGNLISQFYLYPKHQTELIKNIKILQKHDATNS